MEGNARVFVERDEQLKTTMATTTLAALTSSSQTTSSNVTSMTTAQSPPHTTQGLGNGMALQYYSSKIFKEGARDGCTMVMLTYKREGLLPRILRHYCKVSSLQRILVVWNDIDTPVPQALINSSRACKVDIKFVVSKENRLTNRYLSRPEIETECKFFDLIANGRDSRMYVHNYMRPLFVVFIGREHDYTLMGGMCFDGEGFWERVPLHGTAKGSMHFNHDN
jgi:hypothetical protein